MNNPEGITSPGYLRYWGKAKSDPEAPARFHRLVWHSLDVAAVAKVLLELDSGRQSRLAKAAGLPEDVTVQLIVLLAALHDCGKFAPSFQLLSEELALSLQPELNSLPPKKKSYQVRHDSLGFRLFNQNLLQALLESAAFRLMVKGREVTDLDDARDHLRPWAAAMTGHHGKPPQRHSLSKFTRQAKDDAVSFARDLLELLGPLEIPFGQHEEGEEAMKRSSWLVAGVAVLADWIGSNRKWFPYSEEAVPLDKYWLRAQDQARKALAESGVLSASSRSFAGFSELFPEIEEPSPLQSRAETLALSDEPQLFVIEESTGSGKTEAALTLAHRLIDRSLADGIYFALPTMATANAMCDRVNDAVPRLFESSEDTSVVLAHSAAKVRALVRLEEAPKDHAYDGTDRDEEVTATLHCAGWLSDNRKKALLADVGIGTIDQALLAVLPSKHSPLRLFGLAQKVLIVDEVHAYDDYVFRLLERLLEFHAAFGGSAILLSATLPSAMRAQLAASFSKGAGAGEPAGSGRQTLPPFSPASASSSTPLPAARQDGSERGVDVDFPLLTHVSGAASTELPVACRSGTQRDVKVSFLSSKKEVEEAIHACVKRGRCAVWIRNTVADATEAYESATKRWGGDRVTLFHARFVLGDRIRIENQVVKSFGPNSGGSQRAGRVVIATQVVEQSLDLDFDLMISDLAPIDLIVQRAGRLCRHPRDRVGSRCKQDERGRPELLVLAPPWEEEPSSEWIESSELPKTRFVYRHLGQLWLTMRVLREHGAIQTPGSARALVEAVYSEEAQHLIPSGLAQDSERAESRGERDTSLAHLNAVQLEAGYLRTNQQWIDERRTPTRLGEESTRLRLARIESGRVVPLWSSSQSIQLAWHLSEVGVRSRQVCERAPGHYEIEIKAAEASMPDAGRFAVTVVLEPTDSGTWLGQALEGRGKVVTLNYSPSRGLEIERAES